MKSSSAYWAKSGPAPGLHQQLEGVPALSEAQQFFVIQMLDTATAEKQLIRLIQAKKGLPLARFFMVEKISLTLII
ncbi:hypothetical protein [Xanthomonas euvesicatoria]|uniref:hypothetical protein n=1 Tax=Xanthomonas euvesicatoria TaxID=456327 RepID=UPI0011825D67|nr:hypothetical protein [Xanthomonas euvesicatoria]MBV6803802.1 hypothetical protein [Xanthomonas campestris pv. lawsoniae]MBV6869880.1 hypothetical protein [Xanthomonas campestris pv. veroniae]MBV6886942.1 hypothetical protein [Xanthomonas campestris pv. spermacoces]QTK48080.1 hypothetical protein XeaCFBP3836p_02350 [Xanthomonas euvesicatoria pv. alfalfae]